jgi:peptidoglycan biosynthesis protein MviN/MurJ (putative lipid II flippase)
MLLLALIPTAVHFLVMVRYRRKENLTDPTITNIFRHALRLRDHGEKTTTRRRAIFEKVVDTVLAVVIFLIYLYASLAYSISQIYWLPVLLIIGLLLTRIVFIDGGERRITLVRSVVFYLIVAAIVVLRYLALGYPVVPLLQAIVLVGIVAFPILYIWERRSAQEGKD